MKTGGTDAGPLRQIERIGEIDIIRGFALFVVLWMNLRSHKTMIPPDVLEALPTVSIDGILQFLSEWLFQGKALCLFSILFGFGFTMQFQRLDAAGHDNPTAIYARRLGFLLLVGLTDLFLVWWGDILHAYALVGFALLLVRKWPNWLLLTLGIMFTLLSEPLLTAWFEYGVSVEQALALDTTIVENLGRRWLAFRGQDYAALISELAYSTRTELYGSYFGASNLGITFGRFLLGMWIFRQGWLQDPAGHIPLFRRAALILLPIGLTISAFATQTVSVDLWTRFANYPEWTWIVRTLIATTRNVGEPTLALGYGAVLVLICQMPKCRRVLAPVGATGQMALTNYLCHSLIYLVLLSGLGFGLLPQAGESFCLAVALIIFGLQAVASVWWLAHFQHGPAEWLWRAVTYGQRSPVATPRPLAAAG